MIKAIQYYILCLSIIFFSCKKEPILNDCATNSSTPQQPDIIYYTKINPQYTLQCNVDKDTLFDYFIDLNADKINDFKISLQRKQYIWCGNPVSYAYGSLISISSLDSANAITAGNGNIFINNPAHEYYTPNTQLIDSGMIISNNVYQFNRQSEILYNKAMAIGTFINFMGDKYIPIVYKNNHFGWIHVQGFDLFQGRIIVKGFAYKGTPNNPIKAGQIN